VIAEPVRYPPSQASEKSLYYPNGDTNHNPTPQSLPKEQPRPNGYTNHDSNHSDTPEHRPKSSVGDERFIKQTEDWFVEGRYFKIQPGVESEDSQGLRGEEFILLAWRNGRGTAVRVDTLEKSRWSSGMRRSMTAVFPPLSESDPHFPTIFLEEVGPGDSPGATINRYARIDVTETAAFDRYACKDLGILGEDSLDKIREQYLRFWEKQWRLSLFAKKSSA
jgi:hypothetical protein